VLLASARYGLVFADKFPQIIAFYLTEMYCVVDLGVVIERLECGLDPICGCAGFNELEQLNGLDELSRGRRNVDISRTFSHEFSHPTADGLVLGGGTSCLISGKDFAGSEGEALVVGVTLDVGTVDEVAVADVAVAVIGAPTCSGVDEQETKTHMSSETARTERFIN